VRLEMRETQRSVYSSRQRTQLVTLSYTEWWDQGYVGCDLVRIMFFIDRWAEAGENYYVGRDYPDPTLPRGGHQGIVYLLTQAIQTVIFFLLNQAS
jgi:hypothetical protein